MAATPLNAIGNRPSGISEVRQAIVRAPLDTSFPVTITTLEEFRLLEQEHLEAVARRNGFFIESDQSRAQGAGKSRGLRLISRAVGVMSVVSFLTIGILVVRRKMLR